MASFDVSSLTAILVDSGRSKGGSIAGGPAKWLPGPLQVAFPPKGFSEDQARISFCLRSTPEVQATLRELDEWAIAWGHANAQALWGKALSVDQIADRLVRSCKTHEKYDPLLKTKINPKYIRWWGDQNQRRDAPEDWRGVICEPQVLIKGIWLMGPQFGVSLEIQDAKLQHDCECCRACPF
jgi:hypothetical protein